MDEPFADLYVTAGPSAQDSRLYALDLLNLELDRIAPQPVVGIVAECDGTPIVEVVGAGDGELMGLEEGDLKPVSQDIVNRGDCEVTWPDATMKGWTPHAASPNGRRLFWTNGRRVGVTTGPQLDDLEVLGRTELPIYTAVWVRR